MKESKELNSFLKDFDSEATRKAYQTDVSQFLEFLASNSGRTTIKASSKDVQKFIKGLKEQKLANKTINRKIASNRSFYEFAKNGKSVKSNPWIEIEKLEETVRHETRPATPSEANDLLESVDNNPEVSKLHQAILFTLFSTGIKKGELLNLKIGDFYSENKSFFITIFNSRSGRDSTIKLTSACSSKIISYLDEATLDGLSLNPNNYLFRPTKNPLMDGDTNKQINPKTIDYIVKKWCQRAGHNSAISSQSARIYKITEEIETAKISKDICVKFAISPRSFAAYKEKCSVEKFS